MEHWNWLLAGSNGLDGDKQRCRLVRVRLVATKTQEIASSGSSFVWLLIRLPRGRGRDGKQDKSWNEMPWQWMKSID
jgi:hypothetical protein